VYAKNHKILWQEDGTPYVILAHQTLLCHHGPDRNVNIKKKYKEEKQKKRQDLNTSLEVKYTFFSVYRIRFIRILD